MIQIKAEEFIELGSKYGLTKEIMGYEDFEDFLIMFSTDLFIKGFNEGYKAAKEHMFLSTCDCWEV